MCGDLTRIVVTCTGILTSQHSSMGYPFAFIAAANALLPLGLCKQKLKPAISALCLTPIIFGARTLDE